MHTRMDLAFNPSDAVFLFSNFWIDCRQTSISGACMSASSEFFCLKWRSHATQGAPHRSSSEIAFLPSAPPTLPQATNFPKAFQYYVDIISGNILFVCPEGALRQ